MNRQEAQELLPWFVAGTLSDDETRAVQAFIDSGEIGSKDLDELALFAHTVRTQSDFEPAYNPAILSKVMTQLDDVIQAPVDEPLVVQEPGTTPGLFEKLRNALHWDNTPRIAKFALAAQFAAVLALVVMIGSPNFGGGTQVDDGQFETVSGAVLAADFTVGFAPQVTEMQIRELLMSIDASINAGPNSLGMYTLKLADGADLPQSRAVLEQSPITVYVQPVVQP